MPLALTLAAMLTISGTPALAGADTTPPTVPSLLYADGYQCLEVAVLFNRSTDNQDPQSALIYEVFADGAFIGEIWDWGRTPLRGFAYARHPGVSVITLRTVDTSGNPSAFGNAIPVTTFPC
ncbi:hypothetical protein [Rhizohabitans arisaemae]|uniref:hypothetical protein n=1 Tax=Rhizohabitans arisaemae TaxID=2720610 RepID=UPI0024B27EA1|nr:hypothetical protein [Rhizohabitans arisaemae]